MEYGGNLANWTTALHDGTNIIISASHHPSVAGIDLVEVKIHRDLVPGRKMFTRLKTEISAP